MSFSTRLSNICSDINRLPSNNEIMYFIYPNLLDFVFYVIILIFSIVVESRRDNLYLSHIVELM